RQAEERQQFLAEASRKLSASLDYERVLETIVRLVVPALASRGIAIGVTDSKVHRAVTEPPGIAALARSAPETDVPLPPEVADLLWLGVPHVYEKAPPSLAPFLGDVVVDPATRVLFLPLPAR